MVSTKATALACWAADNGLAATRFDYSGHGRSSGRFEDATIGQWLEDAAAVLEQVTAGPQVLVGSSMGGWLALLLARRALQPGSPVRGRVAGLVLIAPAWDMTETLIAPALPPEAYAALAREGVWQRPSRYGDGPYPITHRLLEEGHRHLLQDAPFDPGCRVRILHGMCDPDVPWQHSLKLLELLGGADIRLTLIKDGEHRLARDCDLELLRGTVGALTGSR